MIDCKYFNRKISFSLKQAETVQCQILFFNLKRGYFVTMFHHKRVSELSLKNFVELLRPVISIKFFLNNYPESCFFNVLFMLSKMLFVSLFVIVSERCFFLFHSILYSKYILYRFQIHNLFIFPKLNQHSTMCQVFFLIFFSVYC